ncbi:MAG: hypothetical protein J07HQX50_01327 [Haloquadratum sp. J07HQX50]|nr:MAG: hypothetical protein J07HQX50_01327 [Haloquadratum sp. J07HQX50]
MIKRYIDEGAKKIAVGDLSDIREDNSGGPCGGSHERLHRWETVNPQAVLVQTQVLIVTSALQHQYLL